MYYLFEAKIYILKLLKEYNNDNVDCGWEISFKNGIKICHLQSVLVNSPSVTGDAFIHVFVHK